MSGETLRLGLIYGSTRQGRLCDTIADWAGGEIEGAGGFSVDPVDPRALGLSAFANGESAAAALRARIGRADGIVVVTPEYNHSFPAGLKLAIDAVHAEWRAKPVAFVSYGGISGGLRAVEQLRLVFSELHAVTLRDTVSLAGPWATLDASGRLNPPPGARQAMRVMLTRLKWWAGILREARAGAGYAEAMMA